MRKLRFGMIGGGDGAFIGPIHRTAAAIAGNLELVAGALSSDADRAKRSGANIGLSDERTYGSLEEMIAREQLLPIEARIEAVSIVAPNNVHAPAALLALEAGMHVICDKPLADTLENARLVGEAAERCGKILAITYTYMGYPLVKQARELVANATFGRVRRVIVRYTQDWLSRETDIAGNKQAEWRADPKRSGEGGAFADIGTHASNLSEYITGQRIVETCAELNCLPGRSLDDDGACLFRLSGGAKGVLCASQVCVGDANELAISVYCEEAGLHWLQTEPNTLRIARRDAPEEIWRAGANTAYLASDLRAAQRTPAGHPEGYLEAFANLYRDFANDVRAGASSVRPGYATIEDAIAAMRFVRAANRSSQGGSQWVALSSL